MNVVSLHWFRHRQRALARWVLAAFCLTWLQLAVMPCVMASGAVSGAMTGMPMALVPAATTSMPDGMVMAASEHCVYCPPETSRTGDDGMTELCAFPDDPRVDSRIAFASMLLAPPPTVALVVAPGPAINVAEFDRIALPPPTRTPLAVRYCRFLK